MELQKRCCSTFDHGRALVERALHHISVCACEGDEGCFRCIANPRVDEPTSKAATRGLLETMLAVLSVDARRMHRVQAESLAEESNESLKACPRCAETVTVGDRFCKNCGGGLGD